MRERRGNESAPALRVLRLIESACAVRVRVRRVAGAIRGAHAIIVSPTGRQVFAVIVGAIGSEGCDHRKPAAGGG